MTLSETRFGVWKTFLTAALIVALLGLAVVVANAADSREVRLDRKVRVMERVLDEILMQSPNVVVSHTAITRGVVLEEFGALFVFDASVGTEYLIRGGVPAPAPIGEEGSILVLPRPPRPPRDPSSDEDAERDLESREFESWKEFQEQSERQRAEKYAAFKVELIDALLDYGATLSELEDNQWVAILAYLGSGRHLLGTGSDQRLLLKIKMRDLRQFASGSLSHDAAINRVLIKER